MGIDNNITILSMNVRGLFSNKKKRLDVFDWAKGKHASIICFQETHSSKDVEKIWEEEWDNTCIFCQHNNRSAGVSIMFKKGLDFTIHDTKFDQNGRYIVIDITLFEQRLTLVCLYGYNTDEPLLFDDILYKIALYANTSILLCGDWNVVQDCNLDTYNILHKRNPKSREKIEEIIEKLELLDPWRTCHPTDKNFTWRQPSIKQSRLDYFLVTEDIYSLMKNTKIIPGYKTDHSAIVFTFSASLAKRGKGYWKFNSQLLRDVEYVEKIKTCIKDTISEYYLSGDIQNCLDVKLTCNDQLFFEIMKMKIRTLSISYSIEKNREDREHTSKLEKEVEQLENIMSMSPSVNVQATLHGKKLELENKREQKIEGLLLRSRANWHENGEKCSQYFCKLEKSNFIKKTMAELIDDQAQICQPLQRDVVALLKVLAMCLKSDNDLTRDLQLENLLNR
ncbi:E3.1.11.2 [Mytilus coruscus]|uniref:exodeoxyribonuclease III n=1 Tax=Mytilus coruscus TaxID=42192 RepID=A0A6J8EF01_MYTCO|nr:E3.1.11.2 [Mytilus coruscus]